MHSYAIDSNERIVVPLYIAIVSILVGLYIQNLVDSYNLAVPWWIDVPTVFALYGMFYSLFDKCLWKLRFFRIIGLIKTPNLNGRWKGTILSSYNNFKLPFNMTIKIVQSWTKISVLLNTNSSSSYSTIAGIIVENPEKMMLTYQYLNEPNENSAPTMQMHRGTATLDIQADCNRLVGGWYSNRARQTYGRLSIERICKDTSKPSENVDLNTAKKSDLTNYF